MALQLDDFLVTGRTFEEYVAFFNLDIEAMHGLKVLDCPSGVSGFVAVANRKGVSAQGCDLLYEFSRDDLLAHARRSIELIYKDTAWMQGHNFTFYGSLEGHRRCRESALERFEADYNCRRYRYGRLPLLEYPDESFDLLLSSHLLFVYDDRLDLAFHIDAITEMLRVAKEVRIFPLIDFNNSRQHENEHFSPFVRAVQERFDASIRKVPFEFQPGGGYMMQIRRPENSLCD